MNASAWASRTNRDQNATTDRGRRRSRPRCVVRSERSGGVSTLIAATIGSTEAGAGAAAETGTGIGIGIGFGLGAEPSSGYPPGAGATWYGVGQLAVRDGAVAGGTAG